MRRRVALLVTIAAALNARNHKNDDAIDLSKGVPVVSKIPCDGVTSPEDHFFAKATFTGGNWEREFVLNVYQDKTCSYLIGSKCLHNEKAGWVDAWTLDNYGAEKTGNFGVRSCYDWGSQKPAQYVLTGWYKEGEPNKKLAWKQAVLKRVSSDPEVFEFSDPNGGSARLELKHE